MKLRVDKVNYVRHTLTLHGLQADPEKIRVIVEIPPPSDKGGVQRVLGTVIYQDTFIENKAKIQEPISQLQQKDAAFVWGTQQQLTFDELKQVISNSPVLAYFHNNKQTVLNAYANSTSVGAFVMQEGKPIGYGSRTLTSSEKHYANIEHELLAISWWVWKSHTYLYGREVIVETDHKPFFDCLSRAPVQPTESLSNKYDDIEVHLITQLGRKNDALTKFTCCPDTDETFQVVMEYVLTGWAAD